MIYQLAEGEMAYPQIVAAEKEGNPVGFAALSGLAAVPEKPGQLFAVRDSVLGMQPTIYTIDATKKPAVITETLTVKRDGQPAQKLDIEGIAVDEKDWFWLASEGNSEKLVPHALYHGKSEGRDQGRNRSAERTDRQRNPLRLRRRDDHRFRRRCHPVDGCSARMEG
jgi:alkaline phosphatase